MAKNETMTEAAKAARNAYHRKWQHKNKDKVKQYQARYWENKAAEMEKAEAAGES
jgi:hypothetical protein